MVRDDAMLAFERHATSKIKDTADLLSISTLGFRGEALPSIASVARLHLETRAEEEAAGTLIEINGGKMIRVEEAGLPPGTSIAVRDLFFNTPARKKFLRSEATELSHIASLVTHYALAHPEKHFELHSATNALLVAPAGRRPARTGVPGLRTRDARPADCAGGGAAARAHRAAAASAVAARSGSRDRKAGAGRSPAARLRFETRDPETQPQLDLYFCEWQADPRPDHSARPDRCVPQHPAADGVSRGSAVSGNAGRRGGRERASFENGGAFPAADGGPRFRARVGASGADEGAAGAAIPDGD